MITIAITIDEPTLAALDGMVPDKRHGRSRSALVRVAVQQFVEREQRHAEERREDRIFRKNREMLKRQAKALIAEQAEL